MMAAAVGNGRSVAETAGKEHDRERSWDGIDRHQQRQKRQKRTVQPASDDREEEEQHVHAMPVHPFGVQPAGSALMKDERSLREHHQRLNRTMGWLARLSNELLLHLLSFCSPTELARLSQTSKAMQAFASHEPLWREAMIYMTNGRLRSWQGSWKATLASHCSKTATASASSVSFRQHTSDKRAKGDLTVCSDELFLPLQLASLPLSRFTPATGGRAQYKRLERVEMSTLSKQDFLERFGNASVPCLLTSSQASNRERLPTWNVDAICQLYPRRRIRAEALTMPFSTYAAYAKTCESWERNRAGWIPDESPFYLFDPTLARKMQRDGHFVVPPLFRADGDKADRTTMAAEWDLFALLHERRPDNAWIIAGPKRSGSGWHADPNQTSAYNTVLSGRKLWLLLPPSVTPPGVFISQDGGTVTAPLSIAEWFTDFWRPCVRRHGLRALGGDETLHVEVCQAGETVYVPAGWKHLVVNLDESVAFTQNFVSPAELPAVLYFFKHTPEQISGFRIRRQGGEVSLPSADAEESGEEMQDSDPELDELPDGGEEEKAKLFDLFVQRLVDADPDLVQRGLEGMRALEKQRQPNGAQTSLHRRPREKKGQENWWQTLKQAESQRTSADETHTGSLFSAQLAGVEEELDDVPW